MSSRTLSMRLTMGSSFGTNSTMPQSARSTIQSRNIGSGTLRPIAIWCCSAKANIACGLLRESKSGAFLLLPALIWAGVARIHVQRQKFQFVPNGTLHGEIERAVIAVETDGISRARAQRRFTIQPGIAAEIPYHLRLQPLDKVRHERLLELLLFRQIGILGLVAAPGRPWSQMDHAFPRSSS